MRYLIDGYNLLHAMGLLTGRVGPHGLEQARFAMLGRLRGAGDASASGVTVVFDAAHAPPGAVAEEDYQGIHIRYALEGEADDVIESLIQRDSTPRKLTVVSDDRRIQRAGRRRRCPVLGCMDYLDRLERLRKPKASTPPPLQGKPQSVSEDEARHWLREFADLVDDPNVREALGPDFREEEGKGLRTP